MQINKTQGYNKNFNGLLKFNNITINPNHIVKSKVYDTTYDIAVNRKHETREFWNVLLDNKEHRYEASYITNWFESIRDNWMKPKGKFRVLINDAKEGLTTKTFDEEYLTQSDRAFGLKFHNLKYINMRGKIELINGKTYKFENANYLIQNPTLKEIDITIDKEGNRIKEKFEPLTNNITSWETLWSKAMKEDTVINMNTNLKEDFSKIELY